MSEPIPGHKIDLYVGGERLASMRSASLLERLGTEPAAATTVYGAEESVPGLTSWQASATRLMLVGDVPSERAKGHQILRNALRRREMIEVLVSRPDGGEDAGQAWVVQCQGSWAYDSIYSGSYELKGNGPLYEDLFGAAQGTPAEGVLGQRWNAAMPYGGHLMRIEADSDATLRIFDASGAELGEVEVAYGGDYVILPESTREIEIDAEGRRPRVHLDSDGASAVIVAKDEDTYTIETYGRARFEPVYVTFDGERYGPIEYHLVPHGLADGGLEERL